MSVAYSVAKTRILEAAAIQRASDDVLMQRAAQGLAVVAVRELQARSGLVYGARVLVLVGPGNNGGDALFAGARLARRGASVLAVQAIGRPHPAGLAALLAVGGRLCDLDEFERGTWDGAAQYDLALDGILGIGGRPGLPDRVAALADRLDSWQLPVLAVDLPSGVDADTGAVPAASIRATRTVTFGTLKPCHLVQPASSRCGAIALVDIGLDESLEQPTLVGCDGEDDLAGQWPFPDENSDKYSRGVVGIDSGSEAYPGAAIMNTFGAVYAGAGMVRFLGAAAAARVIEADLPNVVFSAGRVQANLYGSGWGDRFDGKEVIATAADSGVPAVVDADGLRYLPDRLPSSFLLTPHAGELARLLGCQRAEVQADPIAAVQAGAEQTGATVLLKGASQFVAEPGSDQVSIAVPGPSWTAQAGSGDVLAGICAALLAAGVPARRAGMLGASLQAVTAASEPGPLPPQELAKRCAGVLGRLQQRRPSVRRR
jgi:ADP-dependent NAD(P)H-hydrate dehydratase / NAD(P)H-hydrate epimerase